MLQNSQKILKLKYLGVGGFITKWQFIAKQIIF